MKNNEDGYIEYTTRSRITSYSEKLVYSDENVKKLLINTDRKFYL